MTPAKALIQLLSPAAFESYDSREGPTTIVITRRYRSPMTSAKALLQPSPFAATRNLRPPHRFILSHLQLAATGVLLLLQSPFFHSPYPLLQESYDPREGSIMEPLAHSGHLDRGDRKVGRVCKHVQDSAHPTAKSVPGRTDLQDPSVKKVLLVKPMNVILEEANLQETSNEFVWSNFTEVHSRCSYFSERKRHIRFGRIVHVRDLF